MEAFVLSQRASLKNSTLAALETSECLLAIDLPELTFQLQIKNPNGYLLRDNRLFWVLGRPELDVTSASRNELLGVLATNYATQGEFAFEALVGHFVAGVIDVPGERIIIVNDKFCTIPVYYHRSDCLFGASTQLKRLLEATALPRALNHQAIFNYIYFHCIPAPLTIYDGVGKLEPHRLLNSRIGADFYVRSYWKPVFHEETRQSSISLAQALRKNLALEIGKCASEGHKTGAFLSGGLDSSTVASYMAGLKETPVKTFTIGFSESGYDESAYADIVAKAFNTDHHVRYVTPEDICSALPDIAAYFDEPFGNSSALPALFCAREAKANGVDIMLAGDGGDELFAGNDRYAKQKLFLYWERLPDSLKCSVKAAVKWLQKLGAPLATKAASYIFQAEKSVPERLQFYNFLHQNKPESVFTQAFLDSVDPQQPDWQYKARWDEVTAPLVDRMLYLDWKFTLADNDLVKVNNMTAMAGIEVRYPLLGETLLKSAQSIPAQIKLPGTKLRHFYKYALTGVLPHETITKTKHGFGLPFGQWLVNDINLKTLASRSLEALKARNIFHPDFIDMAERKCHEVHASYYGELVWVMMMLELWLASHEGDAGQEKVGVA